MASAYLTTSTVGETEREEREGRKGAAGEQIAEVEGEKNKAVDIKA